MASVVPHHKKVTLWNHFRAVGRVTTCRGRCGLGGEVGLIDGNPVDEQLIVDKFNLFTWETDHSLDELRLGCRQSDRLEEVADRT